MFTYLRKSLMVQFELFLFFVFHCILEAYLLYCASIFSSKMYWLLYNFFRDAEDAVHARDGYDYDGYRLRVEFPRGSQNGGGGRDRFLEQSADV